MKYLLAGLLALTTLSAAPATKTFTGVVSDGICATAGHDSMRMSPTDADCARVCVDSHETPFVLIDGTTVYGLNSRMKAEPFAAQRVTVTGSLDATTKTITIEAITAAN